LPSFIHPSWDVERVAGAHFKSRQPENAYNVLVLRLLRQKRITFTGQP